MTIKLILVAKTRLPFFKEAEAEYIKRLTPFSKIETVVFPAEKKGSKEEIINQEGKKILAKIKPDDFVIVLDKNGKALTSEQLAENISNWQLEISSLTFIIGGTYGLADQIKKRANFALSLSRLTFTHEMARTVLLEQLYRAMMIINHRPYHY